MTFQPHCKQVNHEIHQERERAEGVVAVTTTDAHFDERPPLPECPFCGVPVGAGKSQLYGTMVCPGCGSTICYVRLKGEWLWLDCFNLDASAWDDLANAVSNAPDDSLGLVEALMVIDEFRF